MPFSVHTDHNKIIVTVVDSAQSFEITTASNYLNSDLTYFHSFLLLSAWIGDLTFRDQYPEELLRNAIEQK